MFGWWKRAFCNNDVIFSLCYGWSICYVRLLLLSDLRIQRYPGNYTRLQNQDTCSIVALWGSFTRRSSDLFGSQRIRQASVWLLCCIINVCLAEYRDELDISLSSNNVQTTIRQPLQFHHRHWGITNSPKAFTANVALLCINFPLLALASWRFLHHFVVDMVYYLCTNYNVTIVRYDQQCLNLWRLCVMHSTSSLMSTLPWRRP